MSPVFFFLMAIIFAITLCSSICLSLSSFLSLIFFFFFFCYAGDEVVWQNVPQQQKE